MKKFLNAFAAIGLLFAGAAGTVAATPTAAEAQSRYDGRDYRDYRDGRRYDRRDDRRWRGDRGWRNDRRWRDDRRGGYRNGLGERVIDPRSREARAMGVEYRGGCRYVIRNGRRVCG